MNIPNIYILFKGGLKYSKYFLFLTIEVTLVEHILSSFRKKFCNVKKRLNFGSCLLYTTLYSI